MFDNRITRHLGGRFNAYGSVRLRGHVLARGVAMVAAAVLLTCVVGVASAQAATYYIAPGGNDGAAGTSTATAWKTFTRAWQTLRAGDTLLVMDGTYAQAFVPTVNGASGAPITVKALNDGKATVDGQGVRKTVDLQRDWWVIEGLVARNGTDNVFRVDGNNNVLRRISAYDASDNINSSVIMLLGDNNLVEDGLVAGTGRYMAEVFQGSGNTLRRVFTMWRGWSGRDFCGVAWPNGNNIGVYNASNATVENVVAYGRSLKGVMVQANADTAVANNNAVLGSIAILQGRDYDGSVWTYGTGQAQPTSRPGPTSCTSLLSWSSGAQRYGFGLWGQGTMQGNVFRDVLAANNMGVGFSAMKPSGPGDTNTTLDHATFYNNGAGVPDWEAGQGGNIYIGTGGIQNVTNSRIANSAFTGGEGARLGNRYVNRQLTGDPLLPWPMESRAVSELGVSINAIVTSAIQQGGGVVEPIATPTPAAPTPAPPSPTPTSAPPSPTPSAGNTPAPTSTPVPTSTPAPTELRMTLAAAPQMIRRGGTVTIKVAVSSGVAGKPVRITVTDSAAADLQIAPAETTINAPGEAIFKATDRSGKQGDVHVLKFTAQAAGMNAVEQSVTILVEPVPLFLPAIMAGK